MPLSFCVFSDLQFGQVSSGMAFSHLDDAGWRGRFDPNEFREEKMPLEKNLQAEFQSGGDCAAARVPACHPGIAPPAVVEENPTNRKFPRAACVAGGSRPSPARW